MKNKRIFEIDLLRTIAISLMVSFHVVYDLNTFAGFNISYTSKTWYWIGKTSLLLFIFLSGISSTLSKNVIKNGVKVFCFGLMISVITYILFPKEYIRFGVLHFLGICMIIYPLLKKIQKKILFIMAILSLMLGFYFESITLNTWVFVPVGILYNGFSTLDYVPLFPYLSLYIIGILAGKSFYNEKKSLFKLEYDFGFIRSISKNSLLIYIVHQPIIYFIILILNKFIK
ncbi:DUF1624 domain-containing protein [Caloramator sp. E03]|uniref:heparan-alpha-glucosaminide N-acetyltransferase n=1 Tax=Caloramator sp. E03 TaxID=2576307 RepID=UPI0011109F09|nr:heparan-alpha-glucosaminide N-acetyltransferase [Caloramator sp. E03]QCX34557.1 DUF1624 domain-containing protein [Caloramator sp. E03]